MDKIQISAHLLIFVHSEHVRLFDFVLHPFRFRILFVHDWYCRGCLLNVQPKISICTYTDSSRCNKQNHREWFIVTISQTWHELEIYTYKASSKLIDNWKHSQFNMDNDDRYQYILALWEGILRLKEADEVVLPVRAHGQPRANLLKNLPVRVELLHRTQAQARTTLSQITYPENAERLED